MNINLIQSIALFFVFSNQLHVFLTQALKYDVM